MKDIFKNYFAGKPALDDLEKAHYAYNTDFTKESDGHYWPSGLIDHKLYGPKPIPDRLRNEECVWCKRSRADVRWDSEPAHCTADRPNIEAVILAEEEQFLQMLDSAQDRIPQILEKKFKGELTAEALFYLQSTTGYPPDVVAMFVEQNIEPLMPEFDALMEEHKKKSGVFKGAK